MTFGLKLVSSKDDRKLKGKFADRLKHETKEELDESFRKDDLRSDLVFSIRSWRTATR
jgi:hypothetical protein